LEDIHHLLSRIMPKNINAIEDLRLPFSRSGSIASVISTVLNSSLTDSRTSSITSLSSLKFHPLITDKPSIIVEVDAIRCLINQGKKKPLRQQMN
jgi:hypothetical protein